MLVKVFLMVADLSIISGILILGILIIRAVLRRSYKWTRYVLWGIVALRLTCPFFIDSGWNIIPKSGRILIIEGNLVKTQYIGNLIDGAGKIGLTEIGNDVLSIPGRILIILAEIWLIGFALMLLILAIEYCMLRKKVKYAVSIKKMDEYLFEKEQVINERICFADGIKTSFVMGVCRPKIYLPSNIRIEDIKYIIAHEMVHIKRRDHLWKQVGYLILAVHWFNPLVWCAYILFGHDIEYACDERVIRDIDEKNKKGYIEALLHSIDKHTKFFLSGVAFGMMPIRRRLKEIMDIKKISIGATVTVLIVGILIGAFFANGSVKGNEIETKDYIEASVDTIPRDKWKSLEFINEIPEDISQIESIIGYPDGIYMVITKAKNVYE